MLFDKQTPLPLLTCSVCRSTGYVGMSKCPQCAGMSTGFAVRGHWLFWFYPLTRFHLALAQSRRMFNKFRFVTVLLLWSVGEVEGLVEVVGELADYLAEAEGDDGQVVAPDTQDRQAEDEADDRCGYDAEEDEEVEPVGCQEERCSLGRRAGDLVEEIGLL